MLEPLASHSKEKYDGAADSQGSHTGKTLEPLASGVKQQGEGHITGEEQARGIYRVSNPKDIGYMGKIMIRNKD